MITSDCPMQKQFIKSVNILLELQTECDSNLSVDSFDKFQENYIDFINIWCPTFTYKGAHIVEENE